VGGIINYSAGVFGGPVAQLGARLTGSQKVRGSNPLGSTNPILNLGRTDVGSQNANTVALSSRETSSRRA
jgi:hypothetical protein